jgi:hypothetical protein
MMSKQNQANFPLFFFPRHSARLPFLVYPNDQLGDFAERISCSG